jgi:hypothetical protein
MRMVIARPRGCRALPSFLMCLAWVVPVLGAEAILPGGRVLRGQLRLEKGRFQFLASSRKTSVPLEQVDHVRFPAAKIPPCRLAAVYRLTLSDGQRLTGDLFDLDAKAVRFRPTWAAAQTIPRGAVASITQLPGFLTVFKDDFERDLKAWKITAKPALSRGQHTSGKQSLLLNRAGQAAEYALATPLKAGRAGVNFHDPVTTRGNHWLVEAGFGEGKIFRIIRITIAGDADDYTANVSGASQKGFAVRRREGWHRLQVEFAPKMLLITVDDNVLWVSRLQGPGGALSWVRLVCVAAPGKEEPRGDVYFDDFGLARAVPHLRYQRADPGQDEVWLAGGDQVLGSLLRADRGTAVLKGRFGNRTWAWGKVRGLFLRHRPDAVRTSEGEQVQVWLRTGAGPEPDPIAGQVRGWDAKHLTLRHPVLGDLTIDRARVRRLRWLFHGQRIALDATSHHLGPKGKLVAGLHPPRAEGKSKEWSFHLETVPEEARLRLQVVRLKGPADGIAPSLERGELQTQVVVNGRVVDYLNRHVRRSSRDPRPLTVLLPRRFLRPGKNTLVLRQSLETATGHYESCEVSGLVIEVPR